MPARDTPAASSPEALRRMQRARRRDTGPEIALRSALYRRGLRYRVDYKLPPGLRRRADIAFPRARLAIFVDGCFWHGCPEHGTWPKANSTWWRDKIESNQRRDADTTARLGHEGWTVVRVWEHEDAEVAAARIAALLERELTRHPATGETRELLVR